MASDPLYINNRITIAGWELTEQFVLAGGPGGQNVNKVSTPAAGAQGYQTHQGLHRAPPQGEVRSLRYQEDARQTFGRISDDQTTNLSPLS